MRLILWLFALLILSNTVAYFWPDKSNISSNIYAARSDIAPHFIRLNKEIEDKYYLNITNRNKNEEPASDEVASVIEPIESGLSADCYRLGPFAQSASYDLAKATLMSASVVFKTTRRAAKRSNVYRVYLGPYQSRAAVADARVELKRQQVFDHFVRKESEEAYIISLGIYTTQETANSAISLFDGKLEKVKLKSEQILLPESYWLHFSIPDNNDIRSQLLKTDWGEQSVKMGKFQCQA